MAICLLYKMISHERYRQVGEYISFALVIEEVTVISESLRRLMVSVMISLRPELPYEMPPLSCCRDNIKNSYNYADRERDTLRSVQRMTAILDALDKPNLQLNSTE